jgi:hypothetical protein
MNRKKKRNEEGTRLVIFGVRKGKGKGKESERRDDIFDY